ncbi:TPR domain protein [Pacificimonas flava]|uniref:TPR domain protein n=2 Tax=Pacificimonas flava TaxID=1234595 RepID=M2T7V0_9SPHN|nr:TPR domain protein [Pacificimonas flava]
MMVMQNSAPGISPLRLLTCAAAAAAATLVLPANAALVEEKGLSDYVKGRYAASEGELNRAAGLLEDALGYAPGEQAVLQRTLELAVAAGDEKLAVGVAQRLVDAGQYDSAMGIILVADLFERRRWDELSAQLDQLGQSGFGSVLSPLIKAWTLEARGKHKEALTALESYPDDGPAKGYAEEQLGNLAMVQGREVDAVRHYVKLIEGDEGGNWRARLLLADAYQEAGSDEYASEVLEQALPAPDIVHARAALAAGEDIDEAPQTASAAVSDLLLRLATDLSRGRTVPLSLVFSRSATWLDAENARGWLVNAQLLAASEQYEGALAALSHVEDDPVYAGMAQEQRAALLTVMNREAEALAMLEAAARAPGASAETFMNLGQAYQAQERWDEAITAFKTALEREVENEDRRWQLWFLVGAAEEERGDWQAAEQALRQAIELSPNQALTLNYLGYTLLDRDVKTDEAIALIEQAHQLEPDSGHITDSLGWAQFRRGSYEQAVQTLEEAVASVPGDTTINDHLGDAYWQVGRRLEARFRWRAALDGEPTPEQRADIERKLSLGYDRAVAMREDVSPNR